MHLVGSLIMVFNETAGSFQIRHHHLFHELVKRGFALPAKDLFSFRRVPEQKSDGVMSEGSHQSNNEKRTRLLLDGSTWGLSERQPCPTSYQWLVLVRHFQTT